MIITMMLMMTMINMMTMMMMLVMLVMMISMMISSTFLWVVVFFRGAVVAVGHLDWNADHLFPGLCLVIRG